MLNESRAIFIDDFDLSRHSSLDNCSEHRVPDEVQSSHNSTTTELVFLLLMGNIYVNHRTFVLSKFEGCVTTGMGK